MSIARKILGSIFLIVVLYYTAAYIILSHFIDEIVFMKIPEVKTSETRQFRVISENNELLVRIYGDISNQRCIAFFPGRHGGTVRYEKELFGIFSKQGFTVYAFAYPGYEGAAGKTTFENIVPILLLGLKGIEKRGACKIAESIFVGRSLGGHLALKTAALTKPRGILLDSVGTSLVDVFKQRMRGNFFLRPMLLLPLEKIMKADVKFTYMLDEVSDVPISIFPGDADSLTPFSNLEHKVKGRTNLRLLKVHHGLHSNVYKLAGEQYVKELHFLSRQ